MNIQSTQSEIIKAVQSIQNQQILDDLKNYVHKITNSNNGHLTVNYNEEERILVEKIQEGLSLEITQRFDTLNREQRERKLADVEKNELTELVDTIEMAGVKRLENMMKLAQMWHISVDDVMKKLNIQTAEPYVW